MKAGTYPGNMVLAGAGTEAQPITYKPAGDGPVKFLGRVDAVAGFTLVEGRKRTYVAAATGPVAAVALDLDTTTRVMEGLEAVKSVEEVEAGVLRWFLDEPAGKL